MFNTVLWKSLPRPPSPLPPFESPQEHFRDARFGILPQDCEQSHCSPKHSITLEDQGKRDLSNTRAEAAGILSCFDHLLA